jgi:pyruvate/2-oxoglutarate dehydrogenase complex dihydrolipoamide acyltransferase (E2) component
MRNAPPKLSNESLIGLVVGLSIVILKDDSNAQPTARANAAPGATTSAPEQIDPATPAASESITPQIAPPARSQTTALSPASNVVEELRQARKATEAKAASDAKAATAAKERAEAEPSQAVIEWLGKSKISGVRLAGDASRVILNGEAFSIGEVVNFGLGLEVLFIEETRVLFEDSNGKRYMKRL